MFVICTLFSMSDSFVTYAQKNYHFVALTLALELHCTDAIILLLCAALASSHVFISSRQILNLFKKQVQILTDKKWVHYLPPATQSISANWTWRQERRLPLCSMCVSVTVYCACFRADHMGKYSTTTISVTL